MKENRKISEEIEKTLNSLDGLQNLESNPYLYTRLKTRIEENSARSKPSFLHKPELKPLLFLLLLIINVITTVYFLESNKTSDTAKSSLIKSLKQDYQIDKIQYDNTNME